MTTPRFRVVVAGESRSFPAGDPFLSKADPAGDIVVVVGADAARRQRAVADAAPTIVVELDLECLGDVTGEASGEEGSNVVGFSRFRLGGGAPSNLIEIVVQPKTIEQARAAAVALFQAAGFSVAVCADRPGRIVNRLLRPYLNSALARLDDGLAGAGEIDQAVKLGLGFKRGPIEWLEETGLADHCRVSEILWRMIPDPHLQPARRAVVAANREKLK